MKLNKIVTLALILTLPILSPSAFAAKEKKDLNPIVAEFDSSGEIELLSFTTGVELIGDVGGATKLVLSGFQISRNPDSFSEALFEKLKSRTAYTSVIVKQGNMSYELGNVYVTSYEVSGESEPDGSQVEKWYFAALVLDLIITANPE